MKKIYLQPEMSVTQTGVKMAILADSLPVDPSVTVGDSDGGWAKEDVDWDIWDFNDEERKSSYRYR